MSLSNEEIGRAWNEAHGWREHPVTTIPPVDMRFARLIAARQKEIDADICDQEASIEGIAQRCAAAIRSQK